MAIQALLTTTVVTLILNTPTLIALVIWSFAK